MPRPIQTHADGTSREALAIRNTHHDDARVMTIRSFLPLIEPLEPRIAPAFSSIVDVSLLDGRDGRQFSRPTPGAPDGFATALSGIGDFNDDGVDDFVISAPHTTNGSVYVVFGNPDVSTDNLDVSTLDGANGFRIDGASAGDLAGVRVSGAGDFNNDGVADFILGAPGLGNNRGSAYILFGRSGTFLPEFTLGTSPSIVVLQLNGENADDFTGSAVDGIGDFNKDGFGDVIIGAPGALGNVGAAYIVFGGTFNSSAIRNLGAVDGTTGLRIVGESNHKLTGADVAGIGDFDDDGIADIAVGSSFTDPLPGSTTYVLYGHTAPFNANLLLGNVASPDGFKITGGVYPGKGEHIAGAGDINGDGFDDLLLTSGIAKKKGKDPAAAFAIFGHADRTASTVSLTSLDGTNGFRVTFGKFKLITFTSVAAAGDVNGDGIADFMVGSAGFRGKAPQGVTDGGDNGTSYVIFGHEEPYEKVFDASVLDLGGGFSIVNDPSTKFFVTSLSPAGDINDDGRSDILIGSGKPDDFGAAYAVFGQTRYIATDPSSNAVQFQDIDGDIISVTIPGHKLKQANFAFYDLSGGSPLHALPPINETFFDFKLGPEFANSIVKIKTNRVVTGDGYIHVGRFDAPTIKLKNIKINGDVDSLNIGGSADKAIGTLDVRNLGPSISIGHTTILGSINLLKVRGAMQNTTMDVGNGIASGLKKMIVNGSITESQVNSTGKLKMTVKGGIIDSFIDAGTKVTSLTVTGDVVNSTIRAVGDGSTAQTARTDAIKRLVIKGDIDNSAIFAGYDFGGMLLNGHARIGSVTVKGDWIASDLVAGVDAGADTYFGTADDAAVGGGSFVFPSRIASIVVKGQLQGSDTAGDTFGFVAEQIDKFKVGGAAVFTPTRGANNDLAILTFGSNGDVAVHEVEAPTG